MFCACKNESEAKPNENICPICMGHPGTLPTVNQEAIQMAMKAALALNCEILHFTKFDRKNYFYPDLTKGYQISQYDQPIAVNGWLKIQNSRFKITRVHLEEDTGKLIHKDADTLVDFNRSGVPLIEIVTEPVFENASDVKQFLEELHTLVRFLDISDADMEKGTMRMEPNISLYSLKDSNSKLKDRLPKYKVEVKNINSFRFVRQAIEYEIKRQTEILKKGETPRQETRGFVEKTASTVAQRSKEEAQDYRYFPEPDIPPISFTEDEIDKIPIPELPQQKMVRFVSKLTIKPKDAFILTREKKLSEYFENVCLKIKKNAEKAQFEIQDVNQKVANLIINKKISSSLEEDEFVKRAISMLQPSVVDGKLLDATINRLIITHKKVVEEYKAGKKNALMFLVGACMRELKGKANAKDIIERLKKKILV